MAKKISRDFQCKKTRSAKASRNAPSEPTSKRPRFEFYYLPPKVRSRLITTTMSRWNFVLLGNAGKASFNVLY